jgi:hypothetical protein
MLASRYTNVLGLGDFTSYLPATSHDYLCRGHICIPLGIWGWHVRDTTARVPRGLLLAWEAHLLPSGIAVGVGGHIHIPRDSLTGGYL